MMWKRLLSLTSELEQGPKKGVLVSAIHRSIQPERFSQDRAKSIKA